MNARALLWTGRVMSGVVILFLLMDGTIKLVPIPPVTDSLKELGYPTSDSFARLLGIIVLVGTALYAWPRTALLGAILLTGLFGGAIASHLRLGDPLFSHTLFGAYLDVGWPLAARPGPSRASPAQALASREAICSAS